MRRRGARSRTRLAGSQSYLGVKKGAGSWLVGLLGAHPGAAVLVIEVAVVAFLVALDDAVTADLLFARAGAAVVVLVVAVVALLASSMLPSPQKGSSPSTVHSAEQPSSFSLLPSSHCSPSTCAVAAERPAVLVGAVGGAAVVVLVVAVVALLALVDVAVAAEGLLFLVGALGGAAVVVLVVAVVALLALVDIAVAAEGLLFLDGADGGAAVVVLVVAVVALLALVHVAVAAERLLVRDALVAEDRVLLVGDVR
jgi:hypothetical protein